MGFDNFNASFSNNPFQDNQDNSDKDEMIFSKINEFLQKSDELGSLSDEIMGYMNEY